jgi:replicative DNA helicase
LIDASDHLLYKATNRHAETRTDTKSIMDNYWTKVETMRDASINPAIPTGFAQLDEQCGGLYPGEVTVLAGSEGMGKTTWALSAGRNMVKAGKRVAVFTLEMTQEEIIRTFTAMETGIFKNVLKQYTLSDYQWGLFTKAAGDIANWPMEIVDEFPTLTPIQCRRKLRKLMNNGDIDVVIIDGLWLMEASEPTGERFRDVSVIMRDLNLIARDFNVPILITHQYNAQIDGKKHPTVFFLSESAGVRRNAQMIWGLHRASFYDRDSVDDTTSLYSLKDRNGGSVGAKWPFIYNQSHSRYEGGQYVNVTTESE